jgi:hypothetical protein
MGFPYDTMVGNGTDYEAKRLEDLEAALKKPAIGDEIYAIPKLGAQLAVVTAEQSRAKAILIKYGFKEVAKFKSTHGNGKDLFLLVRGDTVEKIIKKKKKVL